ncbi:MAG TPA: MarR family winged helix-turn-helix transcriptional regulator [Ideonella sp.]|nr:MarR family winged helix-turn-helix transcriptional regulator [Ideonella sp.]
MLQPQTPPAAAPSSTAARPAPPTGGHAVVDLERYTPAYFTWIANKLSRGASQAYLSAFDVGIETWRVLVLLAIEGAISAQRACNTIGMDKSSMSRCFKSMQMRGFITLSLDPEDGRARIATLTPAGRTMHDQIREVALVRERAFMSVLSEAERHALIELLHRLHENLPAVETATRQYMVRHPPQALKHGRRQAAEPDDSSPSSPDDHPGAPA